MINNWLSIALCNLELNQSDWIPFFNRELLKPYFIELEYRLYLEYAENPDRMIFPEPLKIFEAFRACRKEEIKVVIVGQDPYFKEDQANGIAFAVNHTVDNKKIPPTLNNIFKELCRDLDLDKTSQMNTSLLPWAFEGVLLLNSILTVRKNEPGSHKNLGWQSFIGAVIEEISKTSKKPVVFMLWGNEAQEEFESLINKKKHLILKAAHPSPQSAGNGFFFSSPFSKANAFLKKTKQEPIAWEDVNYRELYKKNSTI